MDGQQPPEQADIIFEAVEGVYGPQNSGVVVMHHRQNKGAL
jgi:hypothetical protein